MISIYKMFFEEEEKPSTGERVANAAVHVAGVGAVAGVIGHHGKKAKSMEDTAPQAAIHAVKKLSIKDGDDHWKKISKEAYDKDTSSVFHPDNIKKGVNAIHKWATGN